MLIVAAALLGALILVDFLAIIKFRAYVSRERQASATTGQGLARISVFVPSKGDDGRLLANLETLVNQKYPNAEYVLVTAREDDPARRVFLQLQAARPDVRIKIVAAGISQAGCEKNHNLLKAVAASDPDSDVFVFLDSDGKSDGYLIRKLVTGLADSSAAAVTGFRWYEPRWHVLPEVVRTAWNMSSFVLFSDPFTTFVWGGATALRRKTFEESGIADIWANSMSDDITLTKRLKELHLTIKFLPNCLVLSTETDGWCSLYEWVCRQTLTLSMYRKPIFAYLITTNFIANVLAVGLIVRSAMLGMMGDGLAYGLLGLSWFVHFSLVTWIGIGPIEQMAKASGIEVKLRKGLLIAAMPLAAAFLQMLANFRCLVTKRVKWAGVWYQLDGQTAKRV